MVQADALSRAVEKNETEEKQTDKKTEKVLKIHSEFNHRKSIIEELRKDNVHCSKSELKKILATCFTCAKKDRKHGKNTSYIEMNRPGELIGLDMLEITPKERIIVMIDYFTRFVFAKFVTSKDSEKIVNFVNKVYNNFKFGGIIADNGLEFKNRLLVEWANKNSVSIEFAVPYFHASNGRVERVNRTIREGLKKTPGSVKIKLNRVIDAYNKSTHRALGMSPIEALKEERWNQVKTRQNIYKKEFVIGNTKMEEFVEGDLVLVRNENKKSNKG